MAAIGSFMAQLDATVVNVSLPDIATTLNASFSTVQWVVSGYLLALALTLPLNGWLVGRIGAKAVYLWCFGAFVLASGLCALAWSVSSLIIFRLLQGMAGGLMAPMAQMMVARAAGRHLSRVASAIVVPILLAPLLGPVIAGQILSVASWRWIFLLNIPVGLLALVLAAVFLPDERHIERPRPLDLAGLALLAPALAGFLYGIDHAHQTVGLVLLCAAFALFVLYYCLARKKGDRALIDLRLFHVPVFSTSATIMFLINGVSFAGQMLLPVWLIQACGIAPDRTGLIMLPLGLGMMCTYPLVGYLTEHFGIRKLTMCGAFCAGAGTLLLVFLACKGLTMSLLAVALFLRGAGTGAIGIPVMSASYASVAKADIPMATTTLNIVQRIGGPVLSTLCGTFLGLQQSVASVANPLMPVFAKVFIFLFIFHAGLFLMTCRLPQRLPEPELSAR
ncbi:MAG: DHA2 family efflux MFS transporter permease subunit [Acetobacter papayae]